MPHIKAPDEIYGELFEVVQSRRVFPDSKTFVDATPKKGVAAILDAFANVDSSDTDAIRAFVSENFSLPDARNNADSAAPGDIPPVRERIEALWKILSRDADRVDPDSSLIGLPQPYIVPGGRFREIYYWDSYFTMLGLAASSHVDTIQNMVDNFAYLIDRVGFIPNGNRSYYCTRSQPPLFVLMVELLARVKRDPGVWQTYLGQLAKEYDFWMSGSGKVGNDLTACRRVVGADGGRLNRYWDDSDLPRQESHVEDVELAGRSTRAAASLYRDIRSACESGWDFSARWLEDVHSLESIRASRVAPVDLNAILHKLEVSLANAFLQAGDTARARDFESKAENRKRLIHSLFFDAEEGFFVDLLLPDLKPSGTLSLAGAYPLFFRLATQEQAGRIAEKIHASFLKPGGWVSTLIESGQQWDAPNGWAPLQWVVYRGLKNYGFEDEAREGARRWVENNLAVYRRTGKLMEKYDVAEVGALAEGGEYAVQDGFGWTNGVLLSLMNELGID